MESKLDKAIEDYETKRIKFLFSPNGFEDGTFLEMDAALKRVKIIIKEDEHERITA